MNWWINWSIVDSFDVMWLYPFYWSLCDDGDDDDDGDEFAGALYVVGDTGCGDEFNWKYANTATTANIIRITFWSILYIYIKIIIIINY